MLHSLAKCIRKFLFSSSFDKFHFETVTLDRYTFFKQSPLQSRNDWQQSASVNQRYYISQCANRQFCCRSPNDNGIDQETITRNTLIYHRHYHFFPFEFHFDRSILSERMRRRERLTFSIYRDHRTVIVFNFASAFRLAY